MEPIRFSLVAGPRQRPDLEQSAAEAWYEYVEDIVRAEKLGFDSAFIGEHHFCFANGNSSPFVFLAEAAARTERIRIGTSVICIPFHNPLRVAEDIAAVDIVSRGRFDFGVGVGSQWEEFETFGIDPKERFGRTWEAIDIIDRCLHGGEEVFSHEGRYYNFPNVRWILPPVQDRVPFFFAGMGPKNAARAAKRDMDLIAWDFTGNYERALAEQGKRIEDKWVGFCVPVSIAPTREEAFDAMGPYELWVNNIYNLRRDLDGVLPDESNRLTLEQMREANERDERVAMFSPYADTVDRVIERILPIIRGQTPMGFVNHFGVEMRAPGMRTEDVERTMTLFAREVMPVLREEAAKVREARLATAGAPGAAA
jgi:alkanesulfonate monooxygenase SsuD/methylene tetrahydromethanopterin reductase-like flavin-dependent oxidoreductase (luciferase family)